MRDYTTLLVWQRARSLAVSVSEVAPGIATHRAPGLRAQLVRATLSIGSNIAEGAGRDSRRDFARFVTIAIGSASEVALHLTTAADLALMERSVADRLGHQAVEIRRMLFGLRRALLEREDDEADRRPH